MPLYRLGALAPRIAPTAWVAETATLIGDVELADGASVWWGAVVRGDNERIVIGRHSNVQDSVVLHADPGFPLLVGESVTVGHQVMLHGCTIGDGSLVGIQAIVLNGAQIGPRCLVGAGALVTEGSSFPEGSLILGAPAKAVRPLSPRQLELLAFSARSYSDRVARYRRELSRIEPA